MSVLTRAPDYRVPRLPIRRFTVEEYHRMIETGILGEDEDVELLAGQITPKMSRNAPHDGVLGLIDDLIRSRLPVNWKVRVQCAITTADSEPEPDIAIVRGPLARYFTRHPQPEDIGIVIEVAETSLERDRQEKGPIYAAAGIAFYWIVNTADRVVEVYSEPVGGFYAAHTEFGSRQEVPLILDGQEVGAIPMKEIFVAL